MLTNTERQQIVEEVNAGTYGIDEALDDIAAAQKGEEVRKALYAEALVLNREGHAGSTDMIARQQVANLQTSVNGQISTLRTEVGEDIDDLETALNSGLATQNGKIAAQDATIANVVANYNVEYGSTELWASTGETGALAAGTTVTLSEDVSHFDYIDIYSFCGNSNVLDTVPVDAKLQSSQGYALRWVNLSDPDSGSYKAYVRIIETRLHIIGTTLTIDHQVTYRNGEEVNISGAEITQGNRSTYMGELGIMKIVGRKITANTELEDVRIGADGTEYASAGQAVRAQVNDLESAIPAIDTTLSVAGAAADAKIVGDEFTNVKSALNNGYTPYSAITNGGFSAAGGPNDGAPNRIRTIAIPFSSGEIITIENGSLEHACGMWNGYISSASNTRNDNSWVTHDETIMPTYNGSIVVAFRYPDNSNILPSDFDGSIKIYKRYLKDIEDRVDDLSEETIKINENLPWFQTYPVSIFSHGQVLYVSGEWSDTITRWGTKDLQHADEDIYLSIKDFTPELAYYICYFNQSGTYITWSQWKNKDSGEYKIPADSYYKITITRRSDSPDVATVDYIYQLLKNTGLRKNISENYTRINNGVKIIPQLVGGASGANGRDSSTSSVRNRYKTMLVPKYLYKGSYFYSDTTNMFRYRITKFNTKEPISGTVLIDNYPLPTSNSPVIISEDGYYMIHFMNYTPENSVSIDDIFSHVTFGLYSDRPNEIIADFIAGGAGNFAAPGDCTLFIGQTGKSFLVDGALEDVQGVFLREMQSLGIDNPSYVMISHFHGDHLGGLVHLLENGDMSLDNATVFLPSQRSIDWATEHISADFNIDMYNRFMAIVNAATNITVIRPTNTDVYDIDGICMRIWNADHSIYEGISSNYNDYSLCCYLEYGSVRVCMSGDLGPIGMNNNKGKMLRSQIYKADHHGWLGTSDSTAVHDMKKFYSNILPDFVITEDGSTHDDLYQQDTAPLVSWCESNCIPLIRCHENAPIRIFVSKDSYRFATPVTRYIVSEVES